MTPKRRLNRQETRRRCELATALVNFRSQRLTNFVNDNWDTLRLRFQEDKPKAKSFLKNLGTALRDAWDKAKWETVEQNLERIFAAQDDTDLRRLKPGEAQISPLMTIAEMRRMELFRRPAFKVRLGRKLPRSGNPEPAFEPRDVLDEIAYAIMRAGSLGLLKTCEGQLNGWKCPTPYVIADEGRRRFCYESCGDEAKAKAPSRIKSRKE
jgi:hypothetical protein